MLKLISVIVTMLILSVKADGMESPYCEMIELNKYYLSARGGVNVLKLNKDSFYSNPKRSWSGELEAGFMIDPIWHLGLNIGRTANFNYSSNYEAWDDDADFSTSHNTSFKSEHLMLNGYYHLPVMDLFIPYIGIGGGVARNSIDDLRINVDNHPWKVIKGKTINRPAWNVMFGTLIQLNDANTLKLDVQYRYSDHGKATTENYYAFAGCTTVEECPPHKSKLKFHALLMGLKYEF